MGLLSKGTPLDWEEAKKYAAYVREHGVQQFLACYRRNKDAGNFSSLLWGDEVTVEYTLLHFDHDAKKVTLSLRGYDVLTELMKEEEEANSKGLSVNVLWRPEFARYMLEATPGSPYGLKASELLKVEMNMKLRRHSAAAFLKPNEFLSSITCFPLLGIVENNIATCFDPPINFKDGQNHTEASHSLFVPDEAINPHPRFRTLTGNIRKRRGKKVSINVPMYKDKNTPWPYMDPILKEEYTSGAALPNCIYMDCMCFGMGCSCLQVTLQANQLCEARTLYDQLTVIAPITLALSAGAPIFRGYLADVDCRWNIISASVDDRTNQELNKEPTCSRNEPQWNGTDFVPTVLTSRVIPKSRYDSVSTFLAPPGDAYNDIPLVIDKEIEQTMLKAQVDPMLSKHIAHLFIRDPLVVYRELLQQDVETSTDHFENIQSTNWQTMRLKPPSTTAPQLGWRVEFRAMEVQLTDFENAAYSVFIILLSRLILCYDLNLYIPISLVDVNMQTAQQRDAIVNQQFWFRQLEYDPQIETKREEKEKGCNGCSSFAPRSRSNSPTFNKTPTLPSSTTTTPPSTSTHTKKDTNTAWVLMTMDEILNGSSRTIGLIPLIRSFLDTLVIEMEVRTQVDRYLDFLSDRAAGKIATTANWMRQFVMRHPDYAYDSVVTSTIAYDLLKEVQVLTQKGGVNKVPPVIF